jgi:hypothetical protein
MMNQITNTRNMTKIKMIKIMRMKKKKKEVNNH